MKEYQNQRKCKKYSKIGMVHNQTNHFQTTSLHKYGFFVILVYSKPEKAQKVF